jgi:hypothetical protein
MTVAQRVGATRAYLAAAALIGTTIVWFALATLHPALAAIVTVAMLVRWRSVFSTRRVVLWLEERLPELRYSLAALVEEPETRFRPVLERNVRSARFARPLALAGLQMVGLPLVLLAISRVGTIVERPGARNPDRVTASERRFGAIVTPPAYSRLRSDTLREPTTISALVGSDLRFTGRWPGRSTMPPRPTVVRLGQRLVALEPFVDSAPRVVLELPTRDSVLPAQPSPIRLTASVRDGIGLASAWFELIVSSGSGETFSFKSAVLGRAPANGARELRLETVLRLDTLGLKPGDMVHVRAVARDINPTTDAETGSSETRTLRVFRPGDADSVAVEAALPLEVGKGEVSQRMLIMLTEALVKQQRTLAQPALLAESRNIGRDQTRLRKRVGTIIFTRLTGAPGGDEDEANAQADTVSPGEALLRAASAATGAGVSETTEEEEGGPIIGINKPLLEAYNAMWDAERRLAIGEPRQALPPMRTALAAIQRARAAERLYLRGRPPAVTLDIPRIRLTGKREGIDPTARDPRASEVAATLVRQARFSAALALLQRDPAAAVDSLMLLRVDALSAQPRAAAALQSAISELRAGRDATAPLRAARRALAGPVRASSDTRWSGGGPW